jgi:hypothetical protein
MKHLATMLFVLLITLHAAADEKRFTVPLADSPMTGPAEAPVTVIEFLDFQ